MSRPWLRPRHLLLTAAFLILGACSTVSGPRDVDWTELGWPPAAPRVRLERVISLRQPAGGRAARIFRRIADLERRALLQRPYAAAWHGDDLLVTDPATGRLARVDPRGRVHLAPESALEGPIGIATCRGTSPDTSHRDVIVVSDSRSGRVALLGPDLKLRSWLAEGLLRPTGVACDGDRVFVVETGRHRVLAYPMEPTGAEPFVMSRRGAGEGELNFPAAASLDGAFLWVGDTLNFRLQRLDAGSGDFLGGFGSLGDAPGEMPRVKGIAVDRDGHLWVTDAHLDQVALYEPDGTFLLAIGGRGDAPGEFSFPSGVAAHPDGRIAVVDSLNVRLQVFRLVEPPVEEGETR